MRRRHHRPPFAVCCLPLTHPFRSPSERFPLSCAHPRHARVTRRRHVFLVVHAHTHTVRSSSPSASRAARWLGGSAARRLSVQHQHAHTHTAAAPRFPPDIAPIAPFPFHSLLPQPRARANTRGGKRRQSHGPWPSPVCSTPRLPPRPKLRRAERRAPASATRCVVTARTPRARPWLRRACGARRCQFPSWRVAVTRAPRCGDGEVGESPRVKLRPSPARVHPRS